MAVDALTIDTNGAGAGTGAPGWTLPRREVRAGVALLEADPDLGRRLDPRLRDRLLPMLRVRTEVLDPGVWEPNDLGLSDGALGLLVLDGLLLRDLSVHDRCCAELVGPGDLLRPWTDRHDGASSVHCELEWQVVDGPARVAVLDARTAAIVGRVPILMSELLDRTISRVRALQFQLALTQVQGIDQRIELLMWELADRWGRVTPEGVVLPLSLTHAMVGRLIGARRPSVTTALRRMQEAGTVERRPDGWVLTTAAADAA